MNNQVPSLGRIVRFRMNAFAVEQVAIITGVHSETHVNLRVLADDDRLPPRYVCVGEWDPERDGPELPTDFHWFWPPRNEVVKPTVERPSDVVDPRDPTASEQTRSEGG